MLGVVRARYGDSHVYLYRIAFVPSRSGCRTNERTNVYVLISHSQSGSVRTKENIWRYVGPVSLCVDGNADVGT